MATNPRAITATHTLSIGGMTCASCAQRIEKKLNRLDGVTASVNYATEQAVVTAPKTLSLAQLITTVESTGYSASATRSVAEELGTLRLRLMITAWLTVPVIIISMVPVLQFPFWQWAVFALTTPVITWGAWPFHRAAWINLTHGSATMDTLVSLGTGAAYLWSLVALFFGGAGAPGLTHAFELTLSRHDAMSALYFEVAAAVTLFLLAGRYFEKKSKRDAGAALRALLDLGATDVEVLRDGAASRIPVDELRIGDHFVVRPGEQVASDGVVLDGSAAVDASLLTGESVPVDVTVGDAVTGGTVATNGRLIVRAERVGADTQLAHMARLVAEAQSGKADVQRLADRISGVFVPIVLAVALLTLTVWLLIGAPVSAAFTAAVAVLIIACPCALGLATPTALLVGTGRGAQLGILIRGPEVLESARAIDTVVLDKTGTVTSGEMSLHELIPVAGQDRDELLQLLGAVEAASEHPVAQAIVRAAAREGTLPSVQNFVSVAGQGVTGEVAGCALVVGRESLLRAHEITADPQLDAEKARLEAQGRTVVFAAWNGEVRGIAAVADTLRPSSPSAIAELSALGLSPMLLTGDNRATAEHVAAAVGVDPISGVIAEVLPEEKVAVIAALQAEGRRVAMIGDGVNDAAALARADLGIALGSGTDAAIAAADLTLMRSDLGSAVQAIRLSRRTFSTIMTNLFWAFAYNIAAIPLAALGLLNPMIAGAAMAFSSVFVVGNSLRLRRFDVSRETRSAGE